MVAKLGRLNRRAMDTFGPLYKSTLGKRVDDKMIRLEKAVRWQADHFDHIPVVVVACAPQLFAQLNCVWQGRERE